MVNYWVSVLTLGVVFSMATVGMNVKWGWAGELDLAMFAYVAVGAYMYGVVVLPPSRLPPPDHYILGLQWPFLAGLAVAIVSTMLVSLAVGAVALRKLRGDYFGIVTVAFALCLSLFISQYTPLFDGYPGIYGVVQPLNGTLHLSPTAYGIFFLCLAVFFLVVTYALLELLYRSYFGRALRSVREDQTAASAYGRNVYVLKLKAYVIGSGVAGLAGAFFIAYLSAFNPYAWSPAETFLLFGAIFIGGTANSRGVIVGAFFVFVVIQETTRLLPVIPGAAEASDALRFVIIGLLIIAVLWLRPQGLLPEPRDRDYESTPSRTARFREVAHGLGSSGLLGSRRGTVKAGHGDE
ncbi:MAG: branched-chain amino acid transport system permease protein [Actinomycetota bacterium]|jgi:branched-chain amino acid transport system permease protein|nr:branched-chain amino acid transport system permease protein [Actinomycetota bacterium]